MRIFPLSLLLLPALCLTAMADTVTLKDGTTIDGTITQQDDTQVTITYKVSASITDTRILKTDEIAKIEKTPEDGLAFEQFKNLKPDPWAMLPPENYATTIAGLQAFLDKYPQSSHKAEAQAILKTFQDEQKRQQAGDVKLYGHWIPKSDVPAREKQIESQDLYTKMQASAGQGDIISALNTFTQLEKAYPHSRAYVAAVNRAVQDESALQRGVTTAIANLKVSDDQWKQGVAIAQEPGKSEMVAARQAEIARYDSILDASKKAQVKWPPFIPQSQKSLDAISAVLTTDLGRLTALPLDKMNASVEQSDKASNLIYANDLAGADPLLKNALALWPANEEAAYFQRTALGIQSGQIAPLSSEGLTQSGTAVKKAKPIATPVPAATPEQPSWKDKVDTLVAFLSTIQGAITAVVCIIGLFVIVSFLQKAKRNKINKAP